MQKKKLSPLAEQAKKELRKRSPQLLEAPGLEKLGKQPKELRVVASRCLLSGAGA